MAKPSGIVTLLTDFGTRDPYVGVMKGVVLGVLPTARLVDLGHDIAAQSVVEANFALHGAYPYFPAGTVHVVVVDPGVGSDRRILCVRAHDQTFLAPDNGVLTGIIGPGAAIRSVAEKRLFRCADVSRTFHGRDIFAPVAARLAAGLDPDEVGPAVSDPILLARPLPMHTDAGGIAGEIIHIDAFGNLISNVRECDVLQLEPNRRFVVFRGQKIGYPAESYAQSEKGRPLAILDSFGYLEIAVNRGSALEHFNASLGDRLAIGAEPTA